MSWELILRHCAAIKATAVQTRVSLDLLESQVGGLEAFAKSHLDRETARQELPAHCTGIPDDRCALQSADAWVAYRSHAHPQARYCKGCKALSSNGVTLDP